ncbi:MAG: hypothetical protein KF889_18090 [Alphaproteobacteria bacterium]|nr:hypothetical protein [Alphaproteobacteria bacterium]MCW5744022.1 hypothetical protein [Alphaproteobacteria bacterium]
MLRRLLACLVVLAIALPSAAMGTNLRAAVADCECPVGKSTCDDTAKACDCALACSARVVVAEPALTADAAATLSMPFTVLRPATSTGPPSGAPRDAPFRPPRSTIHL